MEHKKVIGSLGVVVGIAIGLATFFINNENLIARDTDFFLVKYFIIILLTNCSLYFIVYGVLQFIGIIVPYYSEGKTEIDKAKNSVCSVMLILPIIISGTATVFVKSNSLTLKTLWLCFLLYCFFSFFAGLKRLMK